MCVWGGGRFQLSFYVPETHIMHIAVDFLKSLKIAVVFGGGGGATGI
jgi:hypothetical protein